MLCDMLIHIFLACLKNSASIPNNNSHSLVCYRERVLSRHKRNESTNASYKDTQGREAIEEIQSEQIFYC